VRELYERERQHPTAVETIVRHWGYKSMSGPANLSLAALKKFGLLTDEGRGSERRGRLTHLAVDIIANPDPTVRTNAIKQAALLPSMHQELWGKYQNSLPSDAKLRWELEGQRGFTPRGAEDFIRQYKQTVAFAQLDSDDQTTLAATSDSEDEEVIVGQDEPAQRQSFARPIDNSAARFPIPIFNGKIVVVEGEFPLSEEDWNQFMTVLGVMKPALVVRPAQT
jgi:hypothetical protein